MKQASLVEEMVNALLIGAESIETATQMVDDMLKRHIVVCEAQDVFSTYKTTTNLEGAVDSVLEDLKKHLINNNLVQIKHRKEIHEGVDAISAKIFVAKL